MEIALFGATGKMGKSIIQVALHDTIVPFSPSSIDNYMRAARALKADVAIDVSSPDAIELHLSACLKHHIPLVIGTTGLGPDHMDAIKEASMRLPIFLSSNFSIGIAMMKTMLEHLVKYSESAYVDIIEKHGACKNDAPSGTSLELAALFADKSIQNTTPPRSCDHIHIHSIRSTPHRFTHRVQFSFGAEELSLSHTCYDRSVFAQGALKAAEFLVNQKNGLYNMEDLIAYFEVKQS